MWFDDTMGDDSFASMMTVAGATGESGANCGYNPGTCYVNEGSSDCYSYVASANGACDKEGEFGDIAFE
jgi:hypothetical protein